MRYGEKLRAIRLGKEVTLRELALKSDIDVAYLSRVERGTILPPQKEELLDAINKALGLDKYTSKELKDLAAIDNEQLPRDIALMAKKNEGFPMFLRTVANKKMSAKRLKQLTEFINERY